MPVLENEGLLQILIDISSDMGIFGRMEEVVREHVNANPLDFTGESSVHANMGSDPLKLAMVIWWSYCYNCEPSQPSFMPADCRHLGKPAAPL